MANITNGKKLGFRVGSQAALDGLQSYQNANTGKKGVEGVFYLTEDTHRLYVGNSDGSIAPVNEGIVTVANLAALKAITNPAAQPGQFYYLESEKILCVYSGEAGGWVKINENTNTIVDEVVTTTSVAGSVATINVSVNSDSGRDEADEFTITGANGITVTNDADGKGITLSGDTYTLSGAAGTAANQAQIKLDSTNTTNDSAVTIAGGTNVTVTQSGNTITIASKDDDTTLSTLTFTDAEVVTQNGATTSAGFILTGVNSDGEEVESNVLDPVVTVGVASGKKETSHFENGTLTLDVYTKTEIEEKLTSLNAMHYRGTVGTNGTAGTSLKANDGATKVVGIYNNSTLLSDVKVGDTFLLASDLKYGETTIKAGSLLIAQGTEGADGNITAATLEFAIVNETWISDTTYELVANDANTGVILQDNHGAEKGEIIVTGGTTTNGAAINVAANSGSNGTFVVTHGTVTRKDDDVVVKTAQKVNTAIEATVVTGVVTDSTGHITNVQTAKYTLTDTNGEIDTFATSTSAAADKKSGTISTNIIFNNSLGGEVSNLTASTLIKSDSLEVTQVAETSTTPAGLAIDLVWGAFE